MLPKEQARVCRREVARASKCCFGRLASCAGGCQKIRGSRHTCSIPRGLPRSVVAGELSRGLGFGEAGLHAASPEDVYSTRAGFAQPVPAASVECSPCLCAGIWRRHGMVACCHVAAQHGSRFVVGGGVVTSLSLSVMVVVSLHKHSTPARTQHVNMLLLYYIYPHT